MPSPAMPRPIGAGSAAGVMTSRRLSGRVLVEIDANVVALQHHLVGAKRERARRRLDRTGLHVECAEMQGAFDDAVLEDAIREGRGGVGAFVVGDVEIALKVVDRASLVADLERLHRLRRDLGLRADSSDLLRHGTSLLGHRGPGKALPLRRCDTKPRRTTLPTRSL